MGIISAPAVNVEAAVAAGASIQQAVQAAIPAASAPVAAPATITNEPVVLPATGAAPEAAATPVVVEAPAVENKPAVEPNTAPAEPVSKADQLKAKIEALNKQIETASKKREQLEALLRSVDLLDGIKSGSVVVAKVGRAETAKEVVATVVGVQTLGSGDKRFKIYYGQGFDADTVVIQESQILDVRQV